MSSKKDCYILSKLFSDFINGLSESDYECLINGHATINIKKKEITSSQNEVYDSVLKKLINIEEYDLLTKELKDNNNLKKKADRIKFCEYLNITVLNKDTIPNLNDKIINYINNNKGDIIYKNSKREDVINSFEKIAEKIAKIMDEKEAREYIVNCEILSNKANLIKLANILDVYVEKDKTYEDIVNKIVSTVVTAKIRSYKIRNKEFGTDVIEK